MSEILLHYQKIDPTTWVYVSSLLMFGLFFQFNRFWSVRNLDLVLLILLAPGLLMVNQSRESGDTAWVYSEAKESTPTDTPTAAGTDRPADDSSRSADADAAEAMAIGASKA